MAKLSLSVQYADASHDWAADLSRPLLRRWVKAALQQDARLTLRFVDEAEGRAAQAAVKAEHAQQQNQHAGSKDQRQGNEREKHQIHQLPSLSSRAGTCT